eukprot:scaffold53436_cov60-Phaeocystis_antarctica.AAC.4
MDRELIRRGTNPNPNPSPSPSPSPSPNPHSNPDPDPNPDPNPNSNPNPDPNPNPDQVGTSSCLRQTSSSVRLTEDGHCFRFHERDFEDRRRKSRVSLLNSVRACVYGNPTVKPRGLLLIP